MYENVCYKKSFIKEAIMRFDFPSPIPDFDKGLPHKVYEAALKVFPIFEPQKIKEHQVLIEVQETKTKWVEINHLIFHDLSKKKSLIFAENSLTVQVRAYKTFELFLSQTLQALSALCESFPEMRASRVGIRYVNVLNIGSVKAPLDWTKYIQPQLLGIMGFHKKSNLSRAFQILEYNYEEDTVKFQVGIPNPDYPAKIKQRQFVLDIDAFSVGAFDYPEMINKINIGHARIQELFESSITDATRAEMKAVKNVGK